VREPCHSLSRVRLLGCRETALARAAYKGKQVVKVTVRLNEEHLSQKISTSSQTGPKVSAQSLLRAYTMCLGKEMCKLLRGILESSCGSATYTVMGDWINSPLQHTNRPRRQRCAVLQSCCL
jgi:hypothetical protein